MVVYSRKWLESWKKLLIKIRIKRHKCLHLFSSLLIADLCGHCNYQIGVNRIYHYQTWTLRPQLHHCIRSMFSLYWITGILNMWVQNWLNIATHTYDNRNVLNKGDDEVRRWLSMGRPKIIIMVTIWKCVDLTPICSNFPDVHRFHTHILKIIYYCFIDSAITFS